VGDNDEKFIIDTCSILDIKRKISNPVRKLVYRQLSELVKNETLFFPDEVYKELKGGTSNEASDQAYAWAKANRELATIYGDLTKEVIQLLVAHPTVARVIDPEKGSIIEADPYILALALKIRDKGYQPVVLTEESKTSPVKLALPQACGILRLPCMSIITFLEQENIFSNGK
jgi:hypothetical protein